MSFAEQMSDYMQNNDPKIASIQVRIDPFTDINGSGEETNTLDDVLFSSDFALTSFYKGQLSIDNTRGFRERKVHVKTNLKKAVFMMKVFPYTETQHFHIISPRKIIVHSRL